MPFTFATALASFRAPSLSEDRLAVHEIDGGLVVVVADGAGGIRGGAAAADLAVEFVADAVEHGRFDRFSVRSWAELLVHADAIIESDRKAGETTCVVVAIREDGRLVGASVGDSGAIVVGLDGTIDDLTAEQKRKRLGSARAAPFTFERATLDGIIVAATDGLFSYIPRDVLSKTIVARGDLDGAADALVRAVRLPSSGLQDDVGVVLVKAR